MAECVLIVDDDLDIRTSLGDVLTDEGYDVATAANGAEALHYLQHVGAPCLILLDLMMPVMDGWQFAQALHLEPSYREIPVLVISAHTGGAAPPKGVRFLRKPVDLNALLGEIQHDCV